ncbi:MAG: toprim domain-containing protein [Ruminococcus sp.]
MIHIAQAIVVEGKYDKIKLSSILDAVILVTNGFRIFRDPEKMALIQYYARTTGVIVLTDSDRAGFQIRNYLKGCSQGREAVSRLYPRYLRQGAPQGKALGGGQARRGRYPERRAAGGVRQGGRADQ